MTRIRQLPLLLPLCLLSVAIGPRARADWEDPFYPYRVPIAVDIPAAGDYRLELSPEEITGWINERADFRFDPRYFSYDGVLLIEIDGQGHPLPRRVEGGYRILLGRELVANGGFEEQDSGKPVGWQIGHAEFRLEKKSHDGSWCMTAAGADRHGCVQAIQTAPDTWYRFSCRAKGPASVNPHYCPKGQWWCIVPHTYLDPYIPAEGWYPIEYYFHTSDQSNWETGQVRMERYTGAADDVSVRECRVVFVLKSDQPGRRRFWLYYSPSEGITPEVPAHQIAAAPPAALAVQKTGETEYYEALLCYPLSSGPLGDLWYCSTLKKVFENEPPPAAAPQPIRLSAAKNESEALQLVFRPKSAGEIRAVRAGLNGPRKYTFPEASFDVRRAEFVRIHTPSKTGAGYEQVSRSAFTGRLPDPLPKFAPAALAPGGPNVIIWIDVAVPKDAPAGWSRGEITLETSGGLIRVPWELQVWDFTLPDRPTCRTAFQFSRYANTFLFPFHKVGESKEDRYELSRAYVAEMARYKVSARSPQSAGVWDAEKESLGPLGSEEKELSWALETLHVSGFGIGHHSGPTLGSQTVDTAAPTARQYEDLAAMLRKKGWMKDAYIQIDEPQPPHFAGVRRWIDAFRRQPHAKDIPMFAFVYDGQCYDALSDCVDILVPENNDGGNAASLAGIARWPKNKEVWCYWTNTAHQWIDAPNIAARLWAPKVWWMGAKGMATWAIAIWWEESPSLKLENPWVEPFSPWGNGVMAYFYPPNPQGIELAEKDMTVVPSLRFVLTRDGIEDYEYAVLLERLLSVRGPHDPATAAGKAALAALRRPFRTPTTWSVSEVHWQQARAAAARAIEELGKTGEVK
ncbi:MAG: DUF4091 domain-containing protein [Pirellulales bacterium]|nr:DUF4091 domain-containing protein [Pirellulales bacterium]